MPNTPRAKILFQGEQLAEELAEQHNDEPTSGASLQVAPELLAEVLAKTQY